MLKSAIVGIIMGSDSDLPIMEGAFNTLAYFNIPFEVKILSAHRTPKQHTNYAANAEKRGLKVIIAAAGGAAHLPGVTAAQTVLPVIGVPIKSKSLSGLDSLLSIVQMPPGVPVATVSIDGSKNAAILAVQILALSDKNIRQKFKRYKVKLEKDSMAKNSKINY
ncbi:5-(carboxyamino)imidazole ribonucleotide mutase [bacterium BMS3Abin03]|nr:5-(carboxyamino)imidazole ribonucleotide mutase [bacterium BMS3Abin03]MCG6961306.1 5-(carboxyamino)imidazole ribonucleotide mutase [bacterium BMS3Abin03]